MAYRKLIGDYSSKDQRTITVEKETTIYNGHELIRYWVYDSESFMTHIFKGEGAEEDAKEYARQLRDRKVKRETIEF